MLALMLMLLLNICDDTTNVYKNLSYQTIRLIGGFDFSGILLGFERQTRSSTWILTVTRESDKTFGILYQLGLYNTAYPIAIIGTEKSYTLALRYSISEFSGDWYDYTKVKYGLHLKTRLYNKKINDDYYLDKIWISPGLSFYIELFNDLACTEKGLSFWFDFHLFPIDYVETFTLSIVFNMDVSSIFARVN
jgi:hypothetical protein